MLPPDENAPGNATTAAPEKRAGDTNPAVETGTRIITESAAGSATATARGTGIETGKGSERGSTGTAKVTSAGGSNFVFLDLFLIRTWHKGWKKKNNGDFEAFSFAH